MKMTKERLEEIKTDFRKLSWECPSFSDQNVKELIAHAEATLNPPKEWLGMVSRTSLPDEPSRGEIAMQTACAMLSNPSMIDTWGENTLKAASAKAVEFTDILLAELNKPKA